MKNQNKVRAYLAGPDVSLPDPIAVANRKKELCAKYGIEGVFPLDTEIDLSGLSKPEQGYLISNANENLIKSCDIVIANITPFRGPSADVGTVFEIGFARGLGKYVFAYTNDDRRFAKRTQDWIAAIDYPNADENQVKLIEKDSNGMSIEDFGLVDNLMIDCSVISITTPGSLLGSAEHVVKNIPISERFTSLLVFEKCLEFVCTFI